MFDMIRLLRDISVFSDLSWWDLRRVVEKAVIESKPRGSAVITEGQKGDAFYVVLSGRCRLFTIVKTGRERTFGYLRRGDAFGEVSLLTGEDYWASVEVINDAVLLKIFKHDFDSLLKKNPKLAIKFGETIGHQLQSVRLTQKEAKWSRLISVYTTSLPDVRNLFATSLAASLAQESKEPVCLIEFLTTSHAMRSISEIEPILTSSAPRAPVQSLFVRHPVGYDFLTLYIDDDAKGEKLFADMLDVLIRTYNYSILDLPVSVGRTASRIISQSDKLYLLSDGTDEAMRTASHLGNNFRTEFSLKAGELKIVLCNMDYNSRRAVSAFESKLGLPVEASFDALPEGVQKVDIDGSPYVISNPSSPFSRAVRHIARGLSNRLVGLSLGVGAARGLAHIGVIRVLERENILIDMIAGSSMGAMVGAIWAMGKNSYELEDIANRNRGFRPFLKNLIDPNIWPLFGLWKGGFLRGDKAAAFFLNAIGDASFADTIIPIKIMATDINSYREVLFDSGRLVDAVRASIAIPGIFEPVRKNGKILVDGGILNPLPVTPLKRAGVSKIIAVNPLPGPEDIPVAGKFAPRPVVGSHLTTGERMLKTIATKFTGNMFDIIMSSTQIMEYVLSEAAKEEADIVIRPVMRDSVWYEFFETAKYIERGVDEAQKALPEIKRLLEG